MFFNFKKNLLSLISNYGFVIDVEAIPLMNQQNLKRLSFTIKFKEPSSDDNDFLPTREPLHFKKY